LYGLYTWCIVKDMRIKLFFLKNKFSFIFTLSLVSFIYSLILLFLLPEKYSASTTIIPVISLSELAGAQGGVSSMLSLLAGQFATPSQIYADLLKNPALQDSVINKCNLKEFYRARYFIDARKKLKKNTDVEVTATGIINIKFLSTDKEKALHVIESYLHYLNKTNENTIKSGMITLKRFLESETKKIQDSLNIAQEKLENFQREFRILIPEKEIAAFITQLAELKAEEKLLEIQLQSYKKILEDNNRFIKILESKLNTLRENIQHLLSKGDSIAYGAGYYTPADKLPELTRKFLELRRDVEMYQVMYTSLKTELEKLKIKINQPYKSFQIIQPPTLSEKKVWPPIGKFIVLIIIWICLADCLIILSEQLKKKKHYLERTSL